MLYLPVVSNSLSWLYIWEGSLKLNTIVCKLATLAELDQGMTLWVELFWRTIFISLCFAVLIWQIFGVLNKCSQTEAARTLKLVYVLCLQLFREN